LTISRVGFASLGRDDESEFQTASIVSARREAPGFEQNALEKFRGRAGCRERQKRVTALCTKEKVQRCSSRERTGETGIPRAIGLSAYFA
jgi:hypothetical protein